MPPVSTWKNSMVQKEKHILFCKHGFYNQGLVLVTILPLSGYLSLENSKPHFSHLKWEE